MKKKRARGLFGSTYRSVASAVGVTKQAVSNWPDDLPQSIGDRVVGAAVRTGVLKLSPESQIKIDQASD